MNMDRRTFFKVLAAAGVSSALPIEPVIAQPQPVRLDDVKKIPKITSRSIDRVILIDRMTGARYVGTLIDASIEVRQDTVRIVDDGINGVRMREVGLDRTIARLRTYCSGSDMRPLLSAGVLQTFVTIKGRVYEFESKVNEVVTEAGFDGPPVVSFELDVVGEVVPT